LNRLRCPWRWQWENCALNEDLFLSFHDRWPVSSALQRFIIPGTHLRRPGFINESFCISLWTSWGRISSRGHWRSSLVLYLVLIMPYDFHIILRPHWCLPLGSHKASHRLWSIYDLEDNYILYVEQGSQYHTVYEPYAEYDLNVSLRNCYVIPYAVANWLL